jgi:hypothetical protein
VLADFIFAAKADSLQKIVSKSLAKRDHAQDHRQVQGLWNHTRVTAE